MDVLDEPVKTVWGRRHHGGDLSLEEIADRLAAERDLGLGILCTAGLGYMVQMLGAMATSAPNLSESVTSWIRTD